MTETKALLFDVFGTVVDWRGSIARQMTAFAAEHLSPGEDRDWHVFADAWRARYQPAMEAVRSGARAFVVLDQLHRENLDAITPEFGLGSLGEDELARINRFWHSLDPWPDSAPGLTRLKQRFIIAPHSNGNVALMVDLARHGGLPWDAILGAEVTGHYKPVPQSYLRAAEMLGLLPGQCMMVAAHNSDLAAAQKCGLKTAFILRPHEHGPGQQTDLAADGDWDFIVESMEDLARQMGC